MYVIYVKRYTQFINTDVNLYLLFIGIETMSQCYVWTVGSGKKWITGCVDVMSS